MKHKFTILFFASAFGIYSLVALVAAIFTPKTTTVPSSSSLNLNKVVDEEAEEKPSNVYKTFTVDSLTFKTQSFPESRRKIIKEFSQGSSDKNPYFVHTDFSGKFCADNPLEWESTSSNTNLILLDDNYRILFDNLILDKISNETYGSECQSTMIYATRKEKFIEFIEKESEFESVVVITPSLYSYRTLLFDFIGPITIIPPEIRDKSKISLTGPITQHHNKLLSLLNISNQTITRLNYHEALKAKNIYTFEPRPCKANRLPILREFRKTIIKKFDLDKEPPVTIFLSLQPEHYINYVALQREFRMAFKSMNIDLDNVVMWKTNFSEYTVEENARFYNRVSILIADNEESMTNALFMQPNTIIIHQHPKDYDLLAPGIAVMNQIFYGYMHDPSVPNYRQQTTFNTASCIELLKKKLKQRDQFNAENSK